MALDPSVLIEGVGGSAAAVSFVGMRRRAPRVRRDAIEVQLVEAEAAESRGDLGAGDVLAALEAEVDRVATAAAPKQIEPETEPDAEPETVVEMTAVPSAVGISAMPDVAARPAGCGIDPDQVGGWLGRVEDDLRKVRARVEFLEAERARLEVQQRLVSELLASSTSF